MSNLWKLRQFNEWHKGVYALFFYAYNMGVIEVDLMNLSELIEEFREDEFYEYNPELWRGYILEEDVLPEPELAH